MKALLLILLLVGMGLWIVKQDFTISDLHKALDDEQKKTAQLQTDLENAKKDAAAATAKAEQQRIANPLSATTPIPTPASHSGDWMWNKKTPLDDPAKAK